MIVRKKFKLSHSALGLLALLVVQSVCLHLFPGDVAAWLIICFASIGSGVAIYVATEVIEEVRNSLHMFVLLSAVVGEFVLFFACEYWHLLLILPSSFPTLPQEISSLLLQSIMVFVFNPLYMPGDAAGRMLLFVHIASSLGLVLFILQNVTQLQHLGAKKPAAKPRAARRKKAKV